MADSTVSTCKHCGERIVLVNWAIRPGWTHQPAGAAFEDGIHTACHTTVATPTTTDSEEDHG